MNIFGKNKLQLLVEKTHFLLSKPTGFNHMKFRTLYHGPNLSLQGDSVLPPSLNLADAVPPHRMMHNPSFNRISSSNRSVTPL